VKKDIDFTPVKNVHVVVGKDKEGWKVYLINRSENELENVMITSSGFGENQNEKQKTSMLRHMFPKIAAGDYAYVEPIQEDVFHLNNQYWVSYFINGKVFDKKFIFVPDSIIDENLIHIEEIQMQGILHD